MPTAFRGNPPLRPKKLYLSAWVYVCLHMRIRKEKPAASDEPRTMRALWDVVVALQIFQKAATHTRLGYRWGLG